MIELYQFPPNRLTHNFSPFCLKVETYLRMVGFPYEVVKVNNPNSAPKKKLPYIKDDDQTIADSRFIIEYLKDKYGDKLDGDRSPEQMAIAHAHRRMMEEHLAYGLMYSRWVDDKFWPTAKKSFFKGLPVPLSLIIPPMVRRRVVRTLQLQGIGAHSREQIYALANADITALSLYLGEKPFFLDEKPAAFDASAYGFLNNIQKDGIESPLKIHLNTLPNLVRYVERMTTTYFPGSQ